MDDYPEEKKSSKKSSRRRSRSGSGSKSRRHKSRSRSRSRSKSRSRSGSRRRRRRSKSPVDPLEAARLKAEAEEREKHRDEYTVFVSQIHPKVDERDLFEFFSHVGRVEDIRLIRDQRTQKSKGLCYVEFWERDSVLKAVALSGQLIGGYPINVSIVQTPISSVTVVEKAKPMKIYCGNLHPHVSERDLAPVFEAFGTVEYIDLQKDSHGTSKGFGFVLFKNEADGKAAVSALNGLEIAGRQIQVKTVDSAPGLDEPIGHIGDLDDDREGLVLTSAARTQLMQKLQRGGPPIAPPPSNYNQPSQPKSAPASGVIARANPAALGISLIQPTTCCVVKNMFDPKSETDEEFHLDIKEDVEEECDKLGAKPKHIYVDKDSSQGVVYLRFKEISSTEKIVKAFNGRWFASRQIVAEFVSEKTYDLKFGQSK